jgi:outer membrane protein TolC
LIGIVDVKTGNNSSRVWMGCALALLMPTLLSAQVSLTTVVDLAQHNSSAVKLAETDHRKAEAALGQSTDVLVPSLQFGSGLPAVPSVGFMGSPPSIFTGSLQSLVFSMPQKQYIMSARDGVRAATLSLKSAREQVALEASTAYIELDTVNHELEVAHQQEGFAARLVEIEQQRAEAGVDPLSELLQARLTAAELHLKRLHLESRAGTLAQQLASLTGLQVSVIAPDKASIPEIPEIRASDPRRPLHGIEAAQMLARSKEHLAKADTQFPLLPQISFVAAYSRDTTLLNNANSYYARKLKSDNFSSGFQIQIPLFDLGHRDKVKESAAEALRAKVEAEQAERQNDVAIAELTGSLRELDALAEIASLKQQIANQQIAAVQTELESGNGVSATPGAAQQVSPKAEQLAHIDERQKYAEALDASFDLSKARLNLLCALGHMEDWLRELHGK